jgi:hypothetical protein
VALESSVDYTIFFVSQHKRKKKRKELESLTDAKQLKHQRPWIKFGGFINEGLKASDIHFVTRMLKKLLSYVGK